MSRWFWKRAILAVVAGISLGAGSAVVAADKTLPTAYQPNDVIVIKTPGKPDQKVTVIRSRRMIDGRVRTEVKDASGKVFTMEDNAPNGTLDKAAVVQASGDDLPKAKPREYDVPPASVLLASDTPRRRLFGRDKEDATPAPAPVAEPEKKPGFFSRVFGSKKKDEPTPQQRQAQTPQTPRAPALVPEGAPPPSYGTYARPTYPPAPAFTAPAPMPYVGAAPAVPMIPGVPTQMPAAPGGDLGPWTQMRSPTPTAPAFPPPPVKSTIPGVTTGTTRINLTPEPVAPAPSVVAPTVIAPNVTAPIVTAPKVTAPRAPNVSVPSSPALPVVPVAPPIVTPPGSVPFPPQVSVPALPVLPPGPQSMAKPTVSLIRTVSHTEPRMVIAVPEEVKADVKILQHSKSAAERVMAVRSLANGTYGWRPEVKLVLLDIARRDPAPAVRVQCIHELRNLGYFDAGFLEYLADCKHDIDQDVRDAAAATFEKLSPKN